MGVAAAAMLGAIGNRVQYRWLLCVCELCVFCVLLCGRATFRYRRQSIEWFYRDFSLDRPHAVTLTFRRC